LITTYPSGANAAVPVAGLCRLVGEQHRKVLVASSMTWHAGVLTAGTSSFAGYVIGCSPILAGLYPANTTTGNVGGVGTIGGPI